MTQPTETELKLRREITTLEQQVLEKHADNIKLRKQIEFLTLTTNEAGAKISKLTKEVKDAKKTNQELQGELSIVKATTVTNSPEMREAVKEIEYLKKEMTIAREEHEFDNMVHRKEMEDLVYKMRKDGLL